MKTQQKAKPCGLLYTRVSDDDQVRGVSLDDQEAAGRQWFAVRGIDLVAVFREEGKSARTVAKRAEFREAMALVERRSKQGQPIDYFVIYDLSRFARNLREQLEVDHRLNALGTRLDSVSFELTDNAQGRFAKSVLGASNQLSSELSGEKISRAMAARLREGKWPGPAPLGYLNSRSDQGEKVIIIDPVRGKLVRMMFESVAAGGSPSEALDRATALGLRSRKGTVLRLQEARRLLINPFYVGRLVSEKTGAEFDGIHPRLIDDITAARVRRAIVPDRDAPAPAHQRARDEFPLRGFVRCAACGTPLTASFSKGRLGTRYPYYFCWKRGCEERPSARAEALDRQFVELLASVQISPALAPLVEESLRLAWEDIAQERRQEATLAARRLADLKARRGRLIEAFVYQGALDRETYDAELAKISQDQMRAHLEPSRSVVNAGKIDDLLTFASRVLTGTSALWQSAPTSAKRSLQALVFPRGVELAGKQLRTQETAILFRQLGGPEMHDAHLVEQGRAASNLVPAFLAQVDVVRELAGLSR